MQLPAIASGVNIVSGIRKEIEFGIVQDAKMFANLMDRLYENKIGAVVREISFNASDSHAEAGKADVPFQIHLPTHKEPYFSVIDQGLGMDEQTAENIFTWLGLSTKNDTNVAVGAFGVGSKSPFSYVGAFTVITTKDGIRGMYNITKNDQGKPVLQAFGEPEHVEEPNGVTVTIPVEPKDFDTFAKEVSRQLRWMKTKPTFVGESVEFVNPMYNVEETIDEHTYIRRSGGIEVVQGGVAYPVNVDLLLKAMEESRKPRPDSLRHFLKNAINKFNPAFIFETGTIQVAMSREAVSYDQTTAGRILDRLEAVHDILIKRIYDKMASVDTLWAKTMMLRQNIFIAARLFNLEDNQWGVNYAHNDAYIAFPKKMCAEFNTGRGLMRHKVRHYWMRRTRSLSYRLKKDHAPDKIIPNDNIMFAVDDGSDAIESRIRNYLENHRDGHVYLLHAEEAPFISLKLIERLQDGAPVWKETHGAWTRAEIDPMTFTRFLNRFDGANIKFLSELPKPVRYYTGRSREPRDPSLPRPKYVPAAAYRFTGNGSNLEYFKNWEKTFVSPKKMDEEAAYVQIERHTITTGITDTQAHWLNLLYRNDEFPIQVYALRAKDIAKIQGNPNWRPLAVVLDSLKEEKKKHYGKIWHRATIQVAAGDGFREFVDEETTKFLIENRNKIHDPEFMHVLHLINKKFQKEQKTRRYTINSVCSELYGIEIMELADKRRKKDQMAQRVIHERYPLLTRLYGLDDVARADIIHMVNGKFAQIVANNTAGQVTEEVV